MVQIDNIISSNPGGIANRLKCLISMWRICDKHNKKLYLEWVRNHTCGAEFNKLFENDINFITEEIKALGNYKTSQTWRLLTFKDEIEDNFAKVYPTKRGNNIDFEFDRIPINVRENILSYFHKLKPIKVINNIVDKFVENNNVKDLVGVHIRRDDFVMQGKDGTDVSSDEKFIYKMNELIQKDSTTKFLLCTDSQETENKFKKLFEDRIIIYPKKSRDRTSVLNTQQGLVDLLLLSKTKHIIGTLHSTFNEVAWWFGNCKAKVDIIVDENLNKEFMEKTYNPKTKIISKLKQLVFNIFKKIRIFKK